MKKKSKLSNILNPTPSAPKQQQCQQIINSINSNISELISKKRDPHINHKLIDKDIKNLQSKKKLVQSEIRRLQSNAKSARKLRKKKREIEKRWKAANPNDTSIIIQETAGRPNVEKYAPGLHAIIQDIVNAGCCADPRRRSEIIHCVNTTDELKSELDKRGYHLSRSATYLRFMPKDPTTNQGKKHVHTVPVRIFKPQNDEHKSHPSTRFCRADDRTLKEFASYLGMLHYNTFRQQHFILFYNILYSLCNINHMVIFLFFDQW